MIQGNPNKTSMLTRDKMDCGIAKNERRGANCGVAIDHCDMKRAKEDHKSQFANDRN